MSHGKSCGENDEKNIFLRIRKKLSGFSPSQKKIGEFFLNNCSEAVRMSSHDIARKLGISVSTVVRFAAELGYSGFGEMLDDLQSTVFIYSQTPMKKIRDSIDENEPVEDILGNIVQHGVRNLSIKKFAPLNSSFAKVLSAMLRADRIYLLGARSSYCVVQYGGYTLSTVARNIHYFSSSAEDRYERLDELTGNDVVFSISFHRYFKATVEVAAFSKRKGAFVAGITDSILSPIAPYCDELFIVPNDAPFLSYLPAMTLMDALCFAFIRAKGDDAKKLLDHRMEVLLSNNVYTDLE